MPTKLKLVGAIEVAGEEYALEISLTTFDESTHKSTGGLTLTAGDKTKLDTARKEKDLTVSWTLEGTGTSGLALATTSTKLAKTAS